MNRLYGMILASSLVLLIAPLADADEAQDMAVVRAKLEQLMPQAKPDSIAPSVLPGMYEAIYGPQILYVSKDGRYMFEGDLYDLQQRVNLTENKRQAGRVKVLNDIDVSTMIVFAPEHPKYTISAFTDIDCGYCRKLHSQIAEYNKLGIAVRYLAFPRAGVDSPSYDKAVSVWCSKDRKTALTLAKQGKTPEKKTCDNPVKMHMAAAKEVGVSGTPTLVLDDGKVIPGYVEPARLLKILDQEHHKG
jgi:thiol:disulfide interchange protein DsbC